jgi:AcrR family transcriptional regulator
MRQAKTDRRSLRTRQALMQALMDLLRRTRYSAITVQDITEQANIGRSTFYAHFTDKDDLLADGVHRLLAGLDEHAGPTHPGACPDPTLALLHHLAGQSDLYRILAKDRELALFLTALHDEITATLTDRLTARLSPDITPAIPPALLAGMVTSILITSIRTWMEDGLTTSAATIDRMFHTAAAATINAGLHPATVRNDLQ